MPATIQTTNPTAEVADQHNTIDSIGIEFEYPTGELFLDANRSGTLRDEWVEEEGREWQAGGRMTRDHVGAEITSPVLDPHSGEPINWYEETIEIASERGYPFSVNGRGETNFGLHMHLSDVPEQKARRLWQVCEQPWMRLFLCASVHPDSLDPWRHGGVVFGTEDFSRQRIVNDYRHISGNSFGNNSGPGRFEWRLPEPMLPSHLEHVLEFVRIMDSLGVEDAQQYAYEQVLEANNELTPFAQYGHYDARFDSFPPEPETEAGEILYDLMNPDE